MNPIITSMLDDDLYKVSQCQAVIQKFPKALATYSFINRGKHKFSPALWIRLKEQIELMRDLSLKKHELDFLKGACPYLTPPFLEWLESYRYNPDEVSSLALKLPIRPEF
jgi:nicotinate phosphoribosyltransferase